jgi:hypothetical protein
VYARDWTRRANGVHGTHLHVCIAFFGINGMRFAGNLIALNV